jgi:MoxR-like ATPase
MKNMTSEQSRFVEAAVAKFGDVVTKDQIVNLAEEMGEKRPRFIYTNKDIRVGRGKYRIGGAVATPAPVAPVAVEAPAMAAAQVIPMKPVTMTQTVSENFVPSKDPLYVPFGFFNDLKNILVSKMFYPVMVTGLSGNGKTFMVEQACAASNREMIKVSISIETDEDDLIGGNTLVNGNVVYREGPVLNAMRRGAVLVLDEIDRGSNKLLAIQAIAEGKPYINKKTGEIVEPAPGFNIVATANTKGKGSDDGRFIAAQILDEAFLERFPITVEQEYASNAVEKKILKKVFDSLNLNDDDFITKLVDWADIIRKTFYEGGVDEIIATRRLVHIAKAYSIFGDKMKAIELCVNRFDEETKTSFLDLYTKVDGDVSASDDQSVENSEPVDEYVPF